MCMCVHRQVHAVVLDMYTYTHLYLHRNVNTLINEELNTYTHDTFVYKAHLYISCMHMCNLCLMTKRRDQRDMASSNA